MDYKKLPLEFDKNGFNFKQLWREGDYCIYIMSKEGRIRGYESFKTHISPAYELHGNKIGAKEWFPSWSEVGIKMAHSCNSEWQAREKIKEYKEKSNNKEFPEVKAEIEIPNGEFRTVTLMELNSINYVTAYNYIKEKFK